MASQLRSNNVLPEPGYLLECQSQHIILIKHLLFNLILLLKTDNSELSELMSDIDPEDLIYLPQVRCLHRLSVTALQFFNESQAHHLAVHLMLTPNIAPSS